MNTDRILVSHVGSLPRPEDLVAILRAKDSQQPYDKQDFARRVRASVVDVVHRQAELGVDVVDDGEHSKASFSTYIRTRLAGLERVADAANGMGGASKDSLAFPAVYAEMKAMFDARKARLGRPPSAHSVALACTGPVRYVGEQEVQADIDNLRAGLGPAPQRQGFITALSPTNIEAYFENRYYKTQEEYLFAIAEAMRVEYLAIVAAGFYVQIDDPRLITHYDRDPGISLAENRKFIARHVEALNHALRGIPEDRVRLHTCYSTNVAPRVHDLELKHYVDQMLQIRAGCYSIEAANPRHEHEWRVWEETRLPDGKMLMPGVVSHCVYQVEHPELVAERIQRFASVVGRERVIASNDCGFATSAAGDEVHADVAWAKMASLVEGARLASRRLWGRG